MTQTKGLHPAGALSGLALLAAVLALGTAARAQEQPRIEVVPRVPHAGRITSAAFSPDGTRVVTASLDATLKLWDTGTGRLIRTFARHSNEIIAQVDVAYSSDGTRVLSGSQDGIKFWEVATGRVIHAIDPGTFFRSSSVGSIALSPDGTRALAGFHDGSAEIWDLPNGRRLHSLAAGDRRTSPLALAFSPDGSRVLTAGSDWAAKMWDAATGQVIRTFGTPMQDPSVFTVAVVFSPDGTRVAIGGHGGRERGNDTLNDALEVWDAATGQLIRTVKGRLGGAQQLAFSGNGALLVGGAGGLRSVDVATGQLTPTAAPQVLAISADGARALTGYETTLSVWDARSQHLTPLVGHGHRLELTSIATSQGGDRVLAGGRIWQGMSRSGDVAFSVWDLATGRLLRTTRPDRREEIAAVAFPSEGARAILRSPEGLKLWDADTGRVAGRLPVGRASARVLSTDGKWLAASDTSTVVLLELATGKAVRTFEAESASTVALSPDKTRLATGGSNDGRVQVWDTATGALVHTLDISWSWQLKRALIRTWETPITALAFSADGTRLVSRRHGFHDDLKRVQLWNVASGRLLLTFDTHPIGVNSVAFSPDGKRALVGGAPFDLGGSADRRFSLWDTATGRLIHSFDGHSGGGTSVAFTHDGRVLSTSNDGTVRVWQSETGALLGTLLAAEGDRWLAVTPEGFFDASDEAAAEDLLTIVRGLKIAVVNAPAYQVLRRPDLVHAKLAGDPDRKVKAAAAELGSKLKLD
jgi:WD40 repeat protein